jgi:hypothetical protein
MKTILIFAFFAASTAATSAVHAQTYQWKDSSGRTVISDTAPPGAGKSTRILNSAATAPEANQPAEKTAEAPKTTAEKNFEFKLRQQEAKEKAEKAAKEKAAAAEKQENCKRTQQNLKTLQSNQAITTIGEDGQTVVMNADQRNQEMDRARRYIAEACKQLN